MTKKEIKNQHIWALIMGLKETAKIIDFRKDNSFCVGCFCLHTCYYKKYEQSIKN